MGQNLIDMLKNINTKISKNSNSYIRSTSRTQLTFDNDIIITVLPHVYNEHIFRGISGPFVICIDEYNMIETSYITKLNQDIQLLKSHGNVSKLYSN